MTIAITGVSGNMGGGFLAALNNCPNAADKIKLLIRSKKKAKKVLKICPAIKKKVEIIYGGLEDAEACKKLVDGCKYVFNVAAVIPPTADNNPKSTIACNVTGVKNIIAAIEALGENQPALIHISSVAVYGNRCGAHKWGGVGEPLISGPFELYSATKILGEYAVLQSNVKNWVVLRQTAMLHYNMFSDNIHDGLMFHTPVDAPFEWATVKDSGKLLLNLLLKSESGELPAKFFKKVYNIGGGQGTRVYGYQCYDDGFKIIGGRFKNFFKPWYNAPKNFHGMWYTDSDELENYLSFRSQSCADFWKEMSGRHKIYKLGKIVPRGIIAGIVIKPLLKDANSPHTWIKHGDEARTVAYFGSKANYDARKKLTWKDVTLPESVEDYSPMSEAERIEAYGYDLFKADDELTPSDLISVAEAHGGRILNADLFDGDMYKKLLWENSDGDRFEASAYTVLRAGHWEHALYKDFRWEFDRLSKKDRIFARIWLDSHGQDDNNVYYFDSDFNAHVEKIK